jgi:hypothetical protein
MYFELLKRMTRNIFIVIVIVWFSECLQNIFDFVDRIFLYMYNVRELLNLPFA